jgi:endonuclease/exonuclease/phosphatase family metal-dependent hydrolase
MGTINVTWWNLGNFFDTDDDPISNDFDFTVARGWTQDVFDAKKANLAAALAATHEGAGPDLLAVAEIEKDDLLEQLISAMRIPHLRVVQDPKGTSDLRGIDVAMAYNENKLTLVSSITHVVHLRYRTRDIFEVEFKIKDTGEDFVVIAGHWPSRQRGKEETEPLRIAVAENIAYLVQDRVKVTPQEYEDLRTLGDLDPVKRKWETKILVVGDFNDEPPDRSVVAHLKASRELDRVIGETNDIGAFKKETADYRAQEVFLFNPMWKFAAQQDAGTYFLDSSSSGGKMANRYALLDQMVLSRGLLSKTGLRLDPSSVAIFSDHLVATEAGRPRPFDWKKKKGTSDHLPLTAKLVY